MLFDLARPWSLSFPGVTGGSIIMEKSMDWTVLLSRIQFGFTIGFHILFPTLNIGLAIFLAIMEGIWLKTRRPVYMKICRFWMKIFALTFGMGVVSGLVLSYELGTNFGSFTAAIGEILGPLFGYEVLTAFFLEAGFLGVMLFGWKKVGPKLHFMATLMVTIGTVISAFWIISANSWMQTPTGFHMEGTKYVVSSWTAAILNPSFLHRYFHMLLASMVTTSFVVAGVSAWFLVHKRHEVFARKAMSFALWAALILTPTQIFVGDMVGLIVHNYQPIKTAAIEANWNTMNGAPLILFAIPDQKHERNLFAVKIPKGASLINTHKLNGKLQGLTSVPRKDRPHVAPVFFTFRIMVGIGVLLFFVAFYGLFLRWRGTLFTNRLYLKVLPWLTPLGFIATVSGWMTAEIGRQPWVIYNHMRISDGASHVPYIHVAISLASFILVYGVIFSF